MLGQKRFGKFQTAALVVIALVMGANLISPAVAHFKPKLGHLIKHVLKKADPRYVNVGEKAASAATADTATNANLLDNIDSTGFLQTSQVRLDGNVADTFIDNFTSATYTSILSKSFTAPSNGHLFIVGTASFEDDLSFAGVGCLGIRLRLDATAVTNEAFAYIDCSNDADGEFQGEVSASAVIPVTAGSHTVHLDAREFGTGSFIIGRDVSVVFAPTGSGATIPVRPAHGQGGPPQG